MTENRGRFSLYVPIEDRNVIKELKELEKSTKVSMNRQILACLKVCIHTMKKELPLKRAFTMNGVKVIV